MMYFYERRLRDNNWFLTNCDANRWLCLANSRDSDRGFSISRFLFIWYVCMQFCSAGMPGNGCERKNNIIYLHCMYIIYWLLITDQPINCELCVDSDRNSSSKITHKCFRCIRRLAVCQHNSRWAFVSTVNRQISTQSHRGRPNFSHCLWEWDRPAICWIVRRSLRAPSWNQTIHPDCIWIVDRCLDWRLCLFSSWPEYCLA